VFAHDRPPAETTKAIATMTVAQLAPWFNDEMWTCRETTTAITTNKGISR
jgi:hypothetical protein